MEHVAFRLSEEGYSIYAIAEITNLAPGDVESAIQEYSLAPSPTWYTDLSLNDTFQEAKDKNRNRAII